MKYLRISLLVGVPDEIENDVVESDVEEMVKGDMSEELLDTMAYRMVVTECEVVGDETKP